MTDAPKPLTLLPCPFCGGPAVLGGTTGKPFCNGGCMEDDDCRVDVETWNRRAPSDSEARLRRYRERTRGWSLTRIERMSVGSGKKFVLGPDADDIAREEGCE